MKKAILYSAMALATLSMSSCSDDFLVIDPAGSVSEGTLLTESGINYVLTGAYATFNNMTQAQWMGGASLTNHFIGDMTGGDANKGSQSADQPDLVQIEIFGFNAGNSYMSAKWNAIYEGVKRANNVISMAERLGDALPNKEQIIGQALFIKSVWMFEGIKVFGAAIPYVTVEEYEANTDPLSSNVDESGNYVYIWSNVEADLKEAINKLPAKWDNGEYGRATSWQAKALLAKLYVYWSSPYNGTNGTVNHWSDAKSMLKDIIDNGVDAKGQKYKLVNKYGDLFNANAADCDWGGESVFDVQTTISGTQTDTNTPWYGPAIGQPGASGIGGWGFYQPSYDFANSFIVDADGLPLSTSEYRAARRLTIMGSDGFTPETDLSVAVDPRLDISIGRYGVPYLDWGTPTATNGWTRDWTNGGLYMNKKPQPYKSDRGSSSIATTATSSTKNAHLIRYADILLMYAEACLENDGDLATPLQIINQIRTRAANDYIAADATTKGTYTLDDKVNGTTVEGTAGNYRIGLYSAFGSKAEATEALQRERRTELALEGHRWFDLARWGHIGEVLTSYKDYEGQFFAEKYTNNYGSNMITFPIPSTQLVNGKGRIVQNENWK